MNEWPHELSASELAALSAEERIDLLAGLERQRRRVEAAQLQLLAVIQACDPTELGLARPTRFLAGERVTAAAPA